MADVQEPMQEESEPTSPYPATDKKIVFGARKPTEEASILTGIPLIIEAPFPYERTLQWLPNGSVQEKKLEAISDNPPDERSIAEASDTDNEPQNTTTVVVSQEVLLKVNEHVAQSLDRELGGFLLGNRYRCPITPRDYVIIDQFSPAKHTEATEIRLAFTHEAWAQLSDELTGKFLGKLLIGWYHSHPRMDVFLSAHDMEIQNERFPEPWMVALVLEPEKHRGGFFCAREGRVKPNSPVDFFELLERNSRDSVLGWENYKAVDPSTSSTSPLSPTNTASLSASTPQEVSVARDPESEKVSPAPKRRKRSLVLIALVGLLLTAVAVGIPNRQRLRNWLKHRREAAVVMPAAPAQPTAGSQAEQSTGQTQPNPPAQSSSSSSTNQSGQQQEPTPEQAPAQSQPEPSAQESAGRARPPRITARRRAAARRERIAKP